MRAVPYHRGWGLGAYKLGIPVKEYAHHRLSGERWCSEGRHWAPADSFQVRKDGTLLSGCRSCVAERIASFKAAYLAEHGVEYVRKTGGGDAALQESA